MNKIKLMILFISFMSVTYSGISDIFIVYKSGECLVDKDGNGNWVEAQMDMELNTLSLLKVGPDGELEIEIDEDAVLIGSNSTVSINDLLEKMGEKKKIGWLKKVSKLTKSAGGQEVGSTALAGVRGAEGEVDELNWFDEEDEEADLNVEDEFSSGKSLFEEGRFTQAIHILTAIIDRDEAETFRGEIAFYLGVSLFNSLRYNDALPYLNASVKDKNSYYYELALIYKSLTYYFLNNYEEAIEGFDTYNSDFSEGSLKPYALLMLGRSHKELGEKEEARKYFLVIKQNYSTSDIYNDAINELQDL
jgi:TolA-binding protein